MRLRDALPGAGVLLLALGCGDGSGPPPLPPTPHHLSFVAQPLTSLADSAISPAVTVEIRDSVNRRITSATAAITIAFGANPGGATLSGSATVNAVNGSATFSGLKINQRGRGYTLVASSGALTGDASVAFDVFAPLIVDVVAAGSTHSCALKRGVATYCWGSNVIGELGDSSTTPSRFPVRVRTDLQFDTISAGYFLTCGITSLGAGHCWGDNLDGRLGDSSTVINRFSPTPIYGGLSFAEIAHGFFHSCGLTTSGAAYCWGGNNVGQLGDSTLGGVSLSPVPVAGGLTFGMLHTRNFHTCAIATGGAAYCWGDNLWGMLGVADTTLAYAVSPEAVAGGLTFLNITTGNVHTCAVATDATTYCWGDNRAGQLGDGTRTKRWVPTPVTGGHAFVSVHAQGPFTCGLTALGAVWCWGIGYGTAPVAITQPVLFVSISAGYEHVCGVTATGTLYCWGENSNGQLGDGTTTHRSVPVLVVY